MAYAHLPALIQTLNGLDVSPEMLHSTHAAIELTSPTGRWVEVGSDIQIPFEVLSQAGFYFEERT